MHTNTLSGILAIILTVCSSLELRWSSSFNYVWVGPDSSSWIDAEAFCNLVFHTSLASIHSEAENIEAGNLCSAHAPHIWCLIGLNDIDIEGTWEWVDGSIINYTPSIWIHTNADHGGGIDEDCGLISAQGTNAWEDSPCHTVYPYTFICNAPSQDMFVWSENNNYIWVGPTRTSWNTANQFCLDTFDTTLATIHSTTQNTEVSNVCNIWSGYHCFIGLNDINVEGIWQWIDDTSVDFGPVWNSGDPSNSLHSPDGEDCGVIAFGTTNWGDVPCNGGGGHYFSFICNAPQNIEIWSNNKNYIWVGPTEMNLYDADNYCINNFGTHLASIHSQSQYDEVEELCIKWNVKYDLPPTSFGIYQSCYIGLNDINAEGTWQWIDGTPVDFGPIWNSGEPNNDLHTPDGEDCSVAYYGGSGWADIPCQVASFHSTFICNAPPSCDDSGDIMHIDWDVIVNDINGDQVPYYNVTVDIDENELTVNIDADLGYIGTSCADNGVCGFGTTYFISLNSFSSNTLDIFSDSGLNECDNREASSFVGTSWSGKWNVSETPYIKDHVGSDSYLAYPPPGNYWNLTAFSIDSGHKCDRINYFGSFSWFDLQNKCKNPQSGDSSVEVLVDNDWINLTGIFYINIISPLYKDIDSGIYRIYEVTNHQFTMAVSKSVHILASTGISLYKISIIAVNTDEDKFKLDILTEAADYLQLTSGTLLISPNGYEFNIDPLNNGDCLSFKSNICIQTWQISTTHNQTCNNFGGIYGFQWIAQCNPNIINNTRCLSYNGDAVILSVETDFEDKTCDTEIGKIQFDGEMRFYQNNSFTGNLNTDYVFAVGKDSIYVEIELNNAVNTYSIFESKLINVWLCTIDDQLYGSTFSVSQIYPSNTGCLSSIIDNDGYNPYWIIQNFDQTFEYDAMHINSTSNNMIRFSFKTPYILTRDTLWVHTQIELSLVSNTRRMLNRILLDTVSHSIDQMRHFTSSVNIENAIIDVTTPSNTIITTHQQQETDDTVLFYVNPTFCFVLFSIYILFQ